MRTSASRTAIEGVRAPASAQILYEHVARIAQDDPAAAERWLEKVEKHILETAGTLPKAGRVVPELKRDDIRESE